MPNFVSTANFSSSNAGLSTVGYKVFNLDGSQYAARTTSGVVELGTSTGIYRAIITYPQFFQGFVLWDTGSGTPVYASESINPIDADPVLDGVRTQLRSLNTSLSMLLQGAWKKSDIDELQKKIAAIKLEPADMTAVLQATDAITSAIKAININPVVDFKPTIQAPEVKIDLAPVEKILAEFKSYSDAASIDAEKKLKEVIAKVDESVKTAVSFISNDLEVAVRSIKELDAKQEDRNSKSDVKNVIRELNRVDAENNKRAEARLSAVNNAIKQMLSSFEAKLKTIQEDMTSSLKSRDNYEARLAAIKDNLKEIIGSQIDMKKDAARLNDDSMKFLMATFRG